MSNTRAISLVLTIFALLLAGCGDNTETAANTPAAAKNVNLSDFPKADGKKTLSELQEEVSAKQDANILPAANNFVQGRANRLPFGLFTQDRSPIWGPTVMYYATSSTAPAVGPFKVGAHTFAVPPKYQSTTSKADINTVGNGFYTTTIPTVENAEKLGVLTLTKTAAGFEAAAIALPLADRDATYAPGQEVPPIDTPTGTTTAQLDAIDTREPHDDMHQVSLKDALKEKKPIVLLFSTPKLCASRVCAPVTDIAEWVHHEDGDGVIFIHNEIYNDNDINKGYRPQVKAFGLTSEPFAFIIGADGRVSSQLQGPFDEAELQAAIAKAKKS